MKAYISGIRAQISYDDFLTGLDYKRTYSISSLILMFFFFSFIGWTWEVLIHIVEDGMFINRGLLSGPWLPIYGSGGILILVILKRWRDRPLCTFGLIILLCGTLEYVTSIVLESFFGARWWNYSELPFNFQGRVCLTGLLIFGVGGLVFIYLIAPKLDNLIQRIPLKVKRILCCLLILCFLLDMGASCISPNMGFGITSL